MTRKDNTAILRRYILVAHQVYHICLSDMNVK